MLLDVNSAIEDLVYFNKDVFESSHYIPKATISSVEIFRYSHDPNNIQIIKTFQENERQINENLRQQISDPIVSDLDQIINKSPTLKHDLIVYRGIDKALDVKVGDILNNLGFIYCSLDKETATFFLNDTSDCYLKDRRNINAIKPAKASTFFEISVSKHTHFLDLSYFDHIQQYTFSQFLFSFTNRLKVLEFNPDNITHIKAELL